ncbi:MAG TPA: hypothetical protein VIM44_02885 [Rariglobus sp.]
MASNLNKKIDRARNGPGLFEITLGVVLSITLGVLLAVLHLIFKPVEVVAKPPEAAEIDKVYFVEGAMNSNKARQWQRKRQMLTEGSADVVFSEEELNAWMATATPKAPQGAAATALVTPEKINFRIQGGVLQVGVQSKVALLGLTQNLVVQTRGKFVQGSTGFRFTADEFYIGSLPAHMLPGVVPAIMDRIVNAQELPEDLKTTWSKLKLVAVEDNSLHLSLP